MRLRQERSVDDSRYLAPTPKLMSLTGGEGRQGGVEKPRAEAKAMHAQPEPTIG